MTGTRLILGRHGLLRRRLRLRVCDIHQHAHVIGVTKSGKSRFLVSLVEAFLAHGLPFTFLDPHGDTAQLLLSRLVEQGFFHDATAYDRLVYLVIPKAERAGRYLPLNILKNTDNPYISAAHV